MDALIPMNCCLCFTRRTGTLILGYLGSIAALVALITVAAMAIGATISCDQHRCYSDGFIVFICGILVLLLVHAIFSVLLVVGTHKKKTELMTPYLVLHAIYLVVNLVRSFIGIMGTFPNVGLILLSVLFNGTMICLQYYLLCVVNAHYRELKGDFDHKRLVESPDCDEKPMELKKKLSEPEKIKVPHSESIDCKPPPYEP